MQQILFYLGIPNIDCRIICTLIKLLLRIYTVLLELGGEGERGETRGWGDKEMGGWGDGETRRVMILSIATINIQTFNL